MRAQDAEIMKRKFQNGIIILLVWHSQCDTQEQMYGITPSIIWKGGVVIEPRIDFEKRGEQSTELNTLSIFYGITATLELDLSIPLVHETENRCCRSTHLGDCFAGLKYLFWYKTFLGGINDMAIQGFIKVPTGDPHSCAPTGTGSTDIVLTFAARHASIRNYAFFSIGATRTGTYQGFKYGNSLLINTTWLTRLRRPVDYEHLDFVSGIELDLEIDASNKIDNKKVSNTNAIIWYGGPSLFIAYKNVTFKSIVQAPMLKRHAHNQYRFAVAIDASF